MPADRAQDTEAIRAARELRRAIACLAVEVPGEVWDDVYAKAKAVLDENDRLVARLEAAGREVTALRRESKLGAQTQRCTNPDCTIISLGTGYEACPRCGSPLAALAAAAPGEQTPP